MIPKASYIRIACFISWFGVYNLTAQPTTAAVPSEIETLLSRVSAGTSWQDLPTSLQDGFRARAAQCLEQTLKSWGTEGFASKEKTLVEAPTAAMIENIDRVLSVKFASELPEGFTLARDVSHPDLKRMLLRLYLVQTSQGGFMLVNHPSFCGWDGLPVKETELLDHQRIRTISEYMRDTEARLRHIPEGELTETERLLRDKSYFTTRAQKHFDRPNVGWNGSFGLSGVYRLEPHLRPFANDAELLDAYNASMFAEFRDVNLASLQSFVYDYESEFDAKLLSSRGLSPELAAGVLKLGYLYRTRILAHPDHAKPCTFYTAEERAANWDAFTASMISNADGKETMETYATGYIQLSTQRAGEMRELAKATVTQLFPPDTQELSKKQRTQVLTRIEAETRPAAIKETIFAALNDATGTTVASEKFKAAIARQKTLGGYKDGETLRLEDEATVFEMWEKVRAFIKREYSGYNLDIAALVPSRPTVLSGSEGCFAGGGEVTIGLKKQWPKASLYATLLHEVKHAIDQKSQAPVEGAAWEGAATTVERQVWPLFITEAMPGDKTDQLIAQLVTAVDNVRFTATTDATLKIFLRPEGSTTPNSFDYAKQIVSGYGYTDEQTLNLRAKRANAGTQYLQYDYGAVMYRDLLSYLQAGVGQTPRVDAFLLQACGMPSPKKNQVSIDRLVACIKARQ